jgi:hypothetical protein
LLKTGKLVKEYPTKNRIKSYEESFSVQKTGVFQVESFSYFFRSKKQGFFKWKVFPFKKTGFFQVESFSVHSFLPRF